jgi:triacylglycerol lipase
LSELHHVVLVPGFFGFLNLGELTYFSRVSEQLALRLEQLGVRAEVRAVGTLPTASLRSRAATLAEAVRDVAPGDGPLHFVGHSSGGLDIRLLITPSASLPTDVDVAALGARTRTIVTVATPHYGTPLASLATGVLGQKLLQLLSLVSLWGLRAGSKPLRGAVRLAQWVVRVDDLVGLGGSVFEQLYEQVIADFDDERSESLQRFLGHVRGDQALLPQVTPDSLDLFNSSAENRKTVRYGCVITRAKPPQLLGSLRVGFDPMAQLTHAIYQALYRLTSSMPSSRLGPLSDAHVEALVSGYGKVPAPSANDGMVPTRSQIWGEILHVARADHLDVMGYYGDADGGPSHVDWLVTRSGFDRTRFRALWGAVARYIAQAT